MGLLPSFFFLHHVASVDAFCVEGAGKPFDLSARIFSSSGPYFSLIYLSNARFLSSGNKRTSSEGSCGLGICVLPQILGDYC